MGELVDVFAGFDGIGADFGFAFVGGRALGFGAVFTGDSGSFFVEGDRTRLIDPRTRGGG